MDEQAKRFKERNEDYRKIWKLSPMDLQAQARWYDYSRARDDMFAATDTPESPWYVVPSNDQRRARSELHLALPEPDPLRRSAARTDQVPQAPGEGQLQRA